MTHMVATMEQQISNPKQIAEKGEEIYKKYQVAYEKEHAGKFVAVDVKTEKLYVADTAVKRYRMPVPLRRWGYFIS